jgi:hypothetical protein
MLIGDEISTNPNQLQDVLSCLMIVQYYGGAKNNPT